MSVTNPLVKDLKGWIRKLTENTAEITDDNPDLILLCSSLEKCFQLGVTMRITSSVGYPKSADAWHWLEELGERNERFLYSFTSAVESVSQNLKVESPIGKLRLLIRICLTKKCLHMPVQLLVRSPGMSLDHYEPNSILGDEILGEIFLSALLQIGKLQFKLNLKNARFLDDTWQLPKCSSIELVPCKSLGISVCFTKGKALIINVHENSVAAEDDKIQIGDVLDEINGQILTGRSRGKLNKIMKKTSGLPTTLHIIKYYSEATNDLYGPIANLIRSSGVERLQKLLKRPMTSPKKIEIPRIINKVNDTLSANAGCKVTYCGNISTGTEGDVKQIESAIWRLLRCQEFVSIPVRFESLEIGIRVTQQSDETVILNQSYMEISSCGRTANIPEYFAYIAGDTNCNMATNFNAFVFHHRKENEVQTILQSLAQGFHRTHFAV
ncbi:hypothetical protein PV325_005353 [Microctonus aethiopoides]|nr:hypothetical protein PV325_005353 [Microctonus aethiopoides]